jgi:hypothetical protein
MNFREVAEQIGRGFDLPKIETVEVVPNVPKSHEMEALQAPQRLVQRIEEFPKLRLVESGPSTRSRISCRSIAPVRFGYTKRFQHHFGTRVERTCQLGDVNKDGFYRLALSTAFTSAGGYSYFHRTMRFNETDTIVPGDLESATRVFRE